MTRSNQSEKKERSDNQEHLGKMRFSAWQPSIHAGNDSLERAKRPNVCGGEDLPHRVGAPGFFDKSRSKDFVDFSCVGQGFSRKTEHRKNW